MSDWIVGLISRKQKDLAVDIIEGEIRPAQHEVVSPRRGWCSVAIRPIARAERTIRPTGSLPRSPSRGRGS